MPSDDDLQTECLSLLASLYAALTDDQRYAERRTACESWLFQRRGTHGPLASFLRHQLSRAAEARQVARDLSGGVFGRSAAVMLDETGKVVAAGPEAWALLASGSPDVDPLQLPAALKAHLSATVATGAPFPRALRLMSEGGGPDLAGVLLGVEGLPSTEGRPRRVATLLLWDLSNNSASVAAASTAPARPMYLAMERRAASDE